MDASKSLLLVSQRIHELAAGTMFDASHKLNRFDLSTDTLHSCATQSDVLQTLKLFAGLQACCLDDGACLFCFFESSHCTGWLRRARADTVMCAQFLLTTQLEASMELAGAQAHSAIRQHILVGV